MNMNTLLADEYENDGYYDLESEFTHDHIMPLKLNESWAARRLMEALSHLPPNHDSISDSAPMRFQQKVQDEQEQRRQELNQPIPVATAARAASTRLIGNGKVRQMFDERRRGAGIDRGNLLKPIEDARSQTHHQLDEQQLNKGLSTMSLKEKPISGRQLTSDRNNNSSRNKCNSSGTSVNANRLKPVITRKTPPKNQIETSSRPTSSPPNSARPLLMRTSLAATPAATRPAVRRGPMSDRGPVTPPKVRHVNQKSPVTKLQMDAQQAPEGTKTCRYCGRHFNTDRLGKHENVCQRTMSTKRKIFDASKQRVKGTDNEKYNKQPKTGLSRTQSTYSSAAQQQGLRTGVKKSNWRKKHEEFIEAIRAAKKVQTHLARGGKLSDLPPPPPSENPDYIQCPHCGRRFNQQAAERHIPRCATMIHNKPRRSNTQQPAKKR